jgi:hypothetical protein
MMSSSFCFSHAAVDEGVLPPDDAQLSKSCLACKQGNEQEEVQRKYATMASQRNLYHGSGCSAMVCVPPNLVVIKRLFQLIRVVELLTKFDLNFF